MNEKTHVIVDHNASVDIVVTEEEMTFHSSTDELVKSVASQALFGMLIAPCLRKTTRKQRNEHANWLVKFTDLDRKAARKVSRGIFVPPKMCAVAIE